MNDEKILCLVQEAKNGNRRAWNTLYCEILPYLKNCCIRRFRFIDEDVFSEGLLSLMTAVKTFDPSRSKNFKAHLFFASSKRLGDLATKQTNRRRNIEEINTPEEIIDTLQCTDFHDERMTAKWYYSRIEGRAREMVRLFFEVGLNLGEIGIIYNLSRERVRQIIKKAIRDIQKI